MLSATAGYSEATKTLDRFVGVISAAARQLEEMPAGDAARAAKPGAWSPKQELGHLVDSAVNNYVRLIRVQRESAAALSNYDPDAWVERQGYQDREWSDVILLWVVLNRHMLAAARRVPAADLARTCTIDGGKPITLGFLIEDYVDHMVHHLQHIGLDLAQFRRAGSAYA